LVDPFDNPMSQGRVNGLGTHPYELPPSQSVACERYSSQSVTVIRIVLSGFALATH